MATRELVSKRGTFGRAAIVRDKKGNMSEYYSDGAMSTEYPITGMLTTAARARLHKYAQNVAESKRKIKRIAA